MKVYLLAPLSKRPKLEGILKQTVKKLTTLGHTVNDDILMIKSDEVQKGEKEMIKAYKEVLNRIKSSDAIVADVTYPSSGIGFLLATALDENKQVLALANTEGGNTPLPIQASKTKNLTFKQYTTNTLESHLEAFCSQAESRLDTKFILIISPQIDKYLKWASDKRRMHKAQIVRDAVEAKMKKDKEYAKFLKETSF